MNIRPIDEYAADLKQRDNRPLDTKELVFLVSFLEWLEKHYDVVKKQEAAQAGEGE